MKKTKSTKKERELIKEAEASGYCSKEEAEEFFKKLSKVRMQKEIIDLLRENNAMLKALCWKQNVSLGKIEHEKWKLKQFENEM